MRMLSVDHPLDSDEFVDWECENRNDFAVYEYKVQFPESSLRMKKANRAQVREEKCDWMQCHVYIPTYQLFRHPVARFLLEGAVIVRAANNIMVFSVIGSMSEAKAMLEKAYLGKVQIVNG
jgi:hypothetical protein